MASGFMRKFFSFGKKQTEAPPQDDDTTAIAPKPATFAAAAPVPAQTERANPEPVPFSPAPSPEAAATPPKPEIPEQPTPEPEIPAEPNPEPDVPAEPRPEPEIPDRPPAEPDIPEPPRPQPDVPETPPPGPDTPPRDALPEMTAGRLTGDVAPAEAARTILEPDAPEPAVASAEALPAPAATAPAADLDAIIADELDRLEGTPPLPAEGDEMRPSAEPQTSADGKAFVVDVGRRPIPASAQTPAAAPKLSWFQRLRQGLARTSQQLTGQITGIFLKRKLDEDTLQDLEDVLIQADLGVETAMRITDTLASSRYGRDVDASEVTQIMADEIGKVLAPVARPLELDLSYKPHVILVVGVNGTGKTTTIGKLAAKLTRGGLTVTLAAGDTFRAAAIEQLKIWGERTNSTVVSSKLGADAAGLAYDAYERAKANGSDVLIIDTAGRLQNKAELMNELEKVVRVLGKHDPEAPHTVLQTLDATTGQNALNQVEIFRNVAGVNGLVMTKLDGTARGGILVAISARHKLPVYFVGVGEGIDDLEPFEARDFASAIAGVPIEA